MNDSKARVIAFYLPQFYPTEQNDKWWGKGFTEWTNVTKAVPQFKGHYQPHLPADLGFYDLRLPETRIRQAELAREYGVNGFCYYHYWFHGERILERVFQEVFESGEPDFPFCLCWANETWTRTWGSKYGLRDILMEQAYSDEDHLNHIRYLIPIFQDPRYMRVNGRPIFLVYRTEANYIERSQLDRMREVWDRELEKAGLDLYLVSVRTPPPPGFSATVDFFPGNYFAPDRPRLINSLEYRLPNVYGKLFGKNGKHHQIFEYQDVVEQIIGRERPEYKSFYSPVPSWDNTPRRETGALILKNSTPQAFEQWIAFAAAETRKQFEGEERLLFVNAWNEWAEGCHLEPDQRWGHAYLEALQRGIVRNDVGYTVDTTAK